MQVNDSTGKEYTGGNVIIRSQIQIERGYQEGRWMTFLQGKKLGLMVKKGEKGVKIITAAGIKRKNEKSKEEETIRIFGIKKTVFNVDQFKPVK